MGCSQSKIENEEAVSRCKDRKTFMKSAVIARNAFAAAHVTYSMSLKNAGAALSDFAAGEVLHPNHPLSLSSSSSAPADLPVPSSSLPPPPHPPPPNLPPPPPPIPDMPPTPLQRAASMPEFVVSKPPVSGSGFETETIVEEEEEEEEEEVEESFTRRRRESDTRNRNGNGNTTSSSVPEQMPMPIPMPMQETGNPTWDYFFHTEVPGGSLGELEEVRHVVNRAMHTPSGSETVVMGEERESVGVGMVGSGERPPMPPGGGGGRRMLRKQPPMSVASTSNGDGSGNGKRRNAVNMVALFGELDDCFLKASESAHEVSKLLEAARLHYHSNFADNRGHIDHSARLMRVITWNRSFRGLPNAEEFKDDFDSEENETHATVLDKLLAWEKKLYDEVKAGELMKFEYQRKVALLNKQKKRGTQSESLEKTKAAVSHLHTRYIVDMQSMDSTVSEISHLRDDQLYPKLVALVDAMAKMWDAMQGYHEMQLKITTGLRLIDISQSAKETTDDHHERTIQLWAVVQEWHTQFDKMVSHQKEYIRALNSWLKLNLIPIESSLKEKVSSPPRPQNPPIQTLLLAWHDLLDKLPDEHAKSAIYNFAAVLHTIVQQQDDELGYKAKMEESRRSLERKQRQYNKWLSDYLNKKTPSDEMESASIDDGVHKDELMVEKEFVVENAKKKLEDDTETWERQCIQVREKSLTNLKTRLPELFRALSEFGHASSEMYNNLRAISRSQNQKRKETVS
ncbi:protein ROLLING AND ERECT LEAF 2-like [Silene latifolia]|uniref:protein ROLLING AND ERECT LEAF 2-like n=1 Tax=Silene latifolia TaxID=37657 RepID=UPI003D77B3FD